MIYRELDLEPIDMFDDMWWNFVLPEPSGSEVKQPLTEAFQALDVQLIGDYVSEPHYQMLFRDPEADVYFEVSNGDEASVHLALGMQADGFLPPEALLSRTNADRFLEYGKVCYRVVQPLYAVADNLNTYIEVDDIHAHRLSYICWAQFLGPRFVQGFGREVLTRAPAWRNENLSDGGLLYTLSVSPYLVHGPRQVWRQARDYFAEHVVSPIRWNNLDEE